MGSSFSSLFSWLFSRKEVQVMMIGLDGAGKTTILFRMKFGHVYVTTPTIGFNVETVEHKNLTLTVWDVGGQEKIRPLWRKCWNNINALVYVIDSTDRERLMESGYELVKVLDELPENVFLLIFANKQDKMRHMETDEIVKKLRLHLLPRIWHIQPCSAVTGEGLFEGLQWLDLQFRRSRW